jgi:hypothetical protein
MLCPKLDHGQSTANAGRIAGIGCHCAGCGYAIEQTRIYPKPAMTLLGQAHPMRTTTAERFKNPLMWIGDRQKAPYSASSTPLDPKLLVALLRCLWRSRLL